MGLRVECPECRKRSSPQDVIEETLADVAKLISQGVHYLDLEEIIRDVRSGLAAPLLEGVYPAPGPQVARKVSLRALK